MKVKNFVAIVLCLLSIIGFLALPVSADELVYTPRNPSFGGSPLNGSYFLNKAKIQDPHGFLDEDSAGSGYERPSDLDRFTSQLQSSVMHRLANRVVEQAFGENGDSLQGGEYTVGNMDIETTVEGEYVQVHITNITNGESTTVRVPMYE